jgi:glyoxylase-like metal-dependent hydrolase (beta-lactamase superfamily II)
MIIARLEVGVFAENCYVVGCEETREGVVIDPGDEAGRILTAIEKHKLHIKYILITHAHLDHVKEAGAVKRQLNVPLFMHRSDQFLLDNLSAQAAAFGLSTSGVPQVDTYVDESENIEFGKQRFEVLHTPGHSPGSISFVTKGLAFVGDVLFAGSIGRTDLPGGDFDVLIGSIKSKLFPLGDDTLVYPGHGPATAIGIERRTNPFLI